ncbi:MAG: L-threonylcarbamoyladenylate synthase [Desulfosarcinaceae bacterium]|nr:L-threonylcarbamoyladenylate synthase [Desulfosarcinaceae bacterium]
MTTAKRLFIQAGSTDAVDPALVRAAAEIIRQGGVVVCPTSGLYGLAADPFQPAAVQRIFEIKGRPAHMPLLVLIHDRHMLPRLTTAVPPVAKRLMHRFWPGGLTLILPAHPDLPAPLTGGGATVGIRLTAHPVARALAKAAGGVITGTSANPSGKAGCSRIDNLDGTVAAAVDLILDAGALAGGPGSSVVDCTATPPQVLREGAVRTANLTPLINEQPVDNSG